MKPMGFSGKTNKKTAGSMKTTTTKHRGDAAEDAALDHLHNAGLVLVARNYRTPGRGGGEIDLIMRDPRGPGGGTLVFVEVRQLLASPWKMAPIAVCSQNGQKAGGELPFIL